MNWFEAKLLNEQAVEQGAQKSYEVRFIKAETMKLNGSLGHHVNGIVFVRAGLPNRVSRFVINHEIYHINDSRRWGGWLGGELRSNIACGLRDPIGLLVTVSISLNRERIGVYWRSLRKINFRSV